MPDNHFSAIAHRRMELKNKNIKRSFKLRMLKFLVIVTQTLMFHLVWAFFFTPNMNGIYLWQGNLAVTVLYGAVLIMLTRIYRGLDVGTLDRTEILIGNILAQLISNFLFYGLSFFLCERLINPIPLIGLQVCEALFMLIWTKWADKVYWKHTVREKLLIIYRDGTDLIRLSILDDFLKRFNIVKQITESEYVAEMLKDNDIETVLIIGVEANVRNDILKDCLSYNLTVYMLPKIGDVILRGAEISLRSGLILMKTAGATPNLEYLIVKRCFDILVSAIAVVLTSPVFLVTALAIKLDDGGPVFYRQTRLTRDGREFKLLKFRSMKVDAEKDGKAVLAKKNDSRITRVGSFIRACRIDELPQLFNILRGEMSLVGPRPERPEIAAEYEKKLPTFALRLQVKAGLTGYAQIYGRYNSEPYEKLQMDLMYLNNMTMAQDLKLIFATIRILFSKESTSGVEDWQQTAIR